MLGFASGAVTQCDVCAAKPLWRCGVWPTVPATGSAARHGTGRPGESDRLQFVGNTAVGWRVVTAVGALRKPSHRTMIHAWVPREDWHHSA